MPATRRPRDFLVTPQHFGHYEEVTWQDVPDQERDALQAARWQHLVVVGIRDALQYRGLQPEDLGHEAGLGRQQMWRYLRGEVLMPLTLFATAQRLLSVRLVAPSSDAPPRVGTQVEPEASD
jgi:hypothetical protein